MYYSDALSEYVVRSTGNTQLSYTCEYTRSNEHLGTGMSDNSVRMSCTLRTSLVQYYHLAYASKW